MNRNETSIYLVQWRSCVYGESDAGILRRAFHTEAEAKEAMLADFDKIEADWEEECAAVEAEVDGNRCRVVSYEDGHEDIFQWDVIKIPIV